jgi:O-antigen/teichoic acid export membrane protein
MSNSIVVKSALNAAAGLSLLLVGFVCSVIVARVLGPEANGVIAFSLWLAFTASLVAELGTGVTLMRLLPQLKGDGFSDLERRGFAARLLRPVVLSTLLFLVLYGVAFWAAEHQHWATNAPSVVIITGFLFFVQSIGSFSKNYLIGEQVMVTFFRMTAAAGGLQLIGVVIGTVFFGLEGALAGYVCGHVIQFVYASNILRTRPNACGVSTRYLVNSSFLLSVEFFLNSVFLMPISQSSCRFS